MSKRVGKVPTQQSARRRRHLKLTQTPAQFSVCWFESRIDDMLLHHAKL